MIFGWVFAVRWDILEGCPGGVLGLAFFSVGEIEGNLQCAQPTSRMM